MSMKSILLRLSALADQICFSLANFVLTIILARYFSELEFAGYVIGLSAALTVQGVLRSCYVVQYAVLPPALIKARTPKILGQQCIISGLLLLLESLILVSVFMLSADIYLRSIALATTICSLIYAQLEFDRVMFIKHEKNLHPFMVSCAFLFLIGGLWLAKLQFDISFTVVMLSIGLFCVFKTLFLIASLGRPDFIWGMRFVVRDFKKYFVSSVIGSIGYAGHNHVPVFVLGMFAPPIEAAAFGAMRGLLQPLQIVAKSLDIIDKNIFHASVVKHGGMGNVLLRQLGLYGGFAICVLIGTIFFGEFIVAHTYGKKYADFHHILIGWALITGMLAVTLPLETVIVKLNKLNQYNVQRLAAGGVGTICAFLALYVWTEHGAIGAVMACLAGWGVSIMIAFRLVWPVFKNVDSSREQG